jgi:lipopolysaccharide export system protein LptC
VRPLLRTFLVLPGLAALAAIAQNSTRISTDAPILNFRLPMYTVPDGYRAWLVTGSEARVISPNDIDIKELTMTIFSGDGRDHIDTLILSPAARIAPEDQIASGDSPIRVINDNFEDTGIGWRYEHKEKKVSITRHVRVVLQSELKDLLK